MSSNFRGSGSGSCCCRAVVVALLLMNGVRALNTCASCEKRACEPVVCPHGDTLDPCNCCLVCLRGKDENCGGTVGRCAPGFDCIWNQHVSENVTGTCQEKISKAVNLHIDSPSTNLPKSCNVQHYKGCDIEEKQCICNEINACVNPSFQYDNVEECQQDLIRYLENCEKIQCVKDASVCPEDSYKLPGVRSQDGCCFVPEGCSCNPCEEQTCDDNFTRRLIRLGNGKPGSCCSEYECVHDTATCTYENKSYNNHEVIEDMKNCKTCICKDGVLECSPIRCTSSISTCGLMHIPEGSCCRVCVGCTTSTGATYNNSEQWTDDNGCVTCTCENGVVNCQAEFCQHTCVKPIPVEGQCCGECPEPTIIMRPPDFCPENVCDKNCSHGFQKDFYNCDICECAHRNELDQCPAFDCKKKCCNGYRVDEKGCPMCKCRHRKKTKNCTNYCKNGFRYDVNGCLTCDCIDDIARENSSEISAGCIGSDGIWHQSDQYWHDGCRNCICIGSQEMCSLITCPVPRCQHPIVIKGSCCPKCLYEIELEGARRALQVNLSVCEAVHGHTYREGESWKIDSCTFCTCHEGRVLCKTENCPPAPCDDAEIKGDCCPTCPLAASVRPNSTEQFCLSDDNQLTYKHGDAWRASVCQSCICLNGKIQCFSELCPKLTCSHPLLPKNRCCPICPEKSSVSHCLYDGKVFLSGENWIPNECTHCECLNGFIKCTETKCLKICVKPVKIAGQCCPSCAGLERHNSEFLETMYAELPSSSSDIGKTENSSNVSTSLYVILAVVGGIIAFIFGLICCVSFFCWYKHRQVPVNKISSGKIVHNTRPTSMSLEYHGTNGTFSLKSSSLKKPLEKTYYKPLPGSENQVCCQI